MDTHDVVGGCVTGYADASVLSTVVLGEMRWYFRKISAPAYICLHGAAHGAFVISSAGERGGMVSLDTHES